MTPDGRPLIAAQIYGQFNLDHPGLHSDLFFWHGSSLDAKDLLLTFSIAQDPVNQRVLSELNRHGMAAVALNPEATTVREVPVFTRPQPTASIGKTKLAIGNNRPEARQLMDRVTDYHAQLEYWTNLFEHFNVKVYTGWYKEDGSDCAISDALQALGGISTMYLRSYQTQPDPLSTNSSDIAFAYSQSMAETERLGNSNIRYHVTTGYLGDHRFPLLRDAAQEIRESLRKNGARRILAFFDEGTHDDSRWQPGHSFAIHNYSFLLEKVLSDPSLGLVLKPKKPSTIRQILGPVAELLREAEATGRCYVFEGGAMQGSHTPAAAALAADLAIHGHLCAGTAGIEAAMTGVPTLLLDREGWEPCPLYGLGDGKVVFKNWNDLWDACVQHWSSPQGMPGFGDWSPMLDELDPFRDGRAAERMGDYLKWLIQGFQAGMDRETIMADTAERYCQLWGKDKVTQISSTWPLGRVSTSHTELKKGSEWTQPTPAIASLSR